MYYVMSDIHGCLDILKKNIDSIKFEKGDKLILLGDYIDYGFNSYETLKYVYNLRDKAIILMGNHEKAFLDFLDGNFDGSLFDDKDFRTIKTFLSKDCFLEVRLLVKMKRLNEAVRKVRSYILEHDRELISWLRTLPLFFETDKEIFVHAGIDEDEGNLFRYGDEEVFLQKYPWTIGYFPKMIIAGHVSVSTIKGDKNYKGIFYDGMSHIYIDGNVSESKYMPILLVSDGHYYEYTNGKKCLIK